MTTDRFGNFNSAYSFDGNSDWITVNNLSGNYSNISISFWFNNPVASVYYPQYFTWENVGWCQEGSYSPYKSGDIIIVPSNHGLLKLPIPSFSSWHHVVISFDYINQTGTIFLDGQKDSTLVGTGWTTSTTGHNAGILTFGSNVSHDSDQQFTGQLDDIRIYNRALSQPEINSLYHEGLCYQVITVTDTLIINANIIGFNPVTYSNSIKIYPNPTNDHITINYGNYLNWKGYTVKITNSQGQTVFSNKITQQQSYVNLSTWTGKGIYFVHIIDGLNNTIEIKKIILQ